MLKKIEIADIRQSAASLVALNKGYLLYKNKEYKNFSYYVYEDDSTVLEGSCEFSDGTKTYLTVRNKSIGKCDCGEKQLCMHSICLFFLLKDISGKLVKEQSNNSLKLDSERTKEVVFDRINDKLLYDLSEYKSIYHIEPVLVFNNHVVTNVYLNLTNNKTKETTQITNIFSFYEKIKTSKTSKSFVIEYKYDLFEFDEYSKEVIEIITLSEGNIAFIVFSLLQLNKNKQITVKNYTYEEKLSFSTEKPPLNFYLKDGSLYTSERHLNIISYFKNNFLVYKGLVYYGDNTNLVIKLYNLLKSNDFNISLSHNNLKLFYFNIYSLYSDYIVIQDDSEPSVFLINSYLDFDGKKLSLKTTYLIDGVENLYQEYFEKIVNYNNYKNLCEVLEFENGEIKNKNKAYNVLANYLSEFSKYGELFISDNIKDIKFNKIKKIGFKSSFSTNMVSVFYGDYQFNKDQLLEIIRLYNNDEDYFEVSPNNFVSLDSETINVIKKIYSFADFSGNNTVIPLYKAFSLGQDSALADKQALVDFSDEILSYKDKSIKLSDKIDKLIRPYQKDGVKWLNTLYKYSMGGILADDMGLGKTLEIIAFIQSIKTTNTLIVSPTSLLFNWQDEFKKFDNTINVEVIYGDKTIRNKTIEKEIGKSILITSYETMRSDLAIYKKHTFDLLILDEAQYIKNPQAKKSIAVKQLSAKAKFALTGTPIENSLVDLWSIFDFILPGYLDTRRDFLNQYFSKQDMLKNKIAPFLLRRNKLEVLDLKPKISNFSYAVMSKKQRALYESYLYKGKEMLGNKEYSKTALITFLVRLRQLSCDPRMFIPEYNGDVCKLTLLKEIVQEKILDEHKILIFSQFTSSFEYIGKMLDDLKIKYLVLTGKTSAAKRMEMVNDFNNNSGIKVFLISLKAGGNGVNLVSADTVIHYDPWWNIAAMNQATDRAYRFGQTKSVHVIKLITKDSIEEKIVNLQQEKAMLSDEFINENKIINKLSKDDILNLFK